MPGTETRTQLPLLSAAAGCGCCSPAAVAPSARSAVAMDDGGARDSAAPNDAVVTAEFPVEGLTCGHCVKSVEEAVSAVDGVQDATVNLVPGGRSHLVVVGPADHAAVRDAVTSAGYSVISR
jgi:copper chaperone